VSVSHHLKMEIGMPRGTPKNRENGKAISKMEAVRRTLAKLGNDAMPAAIQKHIKEKFGVQMDPNMISNYKSAIKTASKSAIIRSPNASTKVPTKAAGGLTPEDVRAVKELVGKIGADQVRQLAEVLGK
jgi:actin-like ATPase involved in cell morphogenesis